MATTTLVKGGRASRSTITLKILMAASGLILMTFVFVHMYGNLKAFQGQDAFNVYAHHLRGMGEPYLPREGLLWILRFTLLLAVVVHAAAAAALWRRARQARTTQYVMKKNLASSFSSRWMRWGGVTILLFLIWHLLNFTVPKVNITGGETNDPYNLLVETFEVWWMTLIYLAAMFALGMHLHHGTWSAAQTLGLTNNAAARRNARIIGWVFAVVVAGGFSLVPIAVLTGIIN